LALDPSPELDSLRTQDLLGLVRDGDQDAWREVYRRYRALLIIATREITGPDREDPEDVLQSAFLSAWKDIKQFEYRGKGSLRAWLRKIVVNKNREKLRSLKRARRLLPNKGFASGVLETVPDVHGQDGLKQLEKSDDEARLFSYMSEKLDPLEAEILTLRLLEKFSTAEIAEIVELEPDKVRKTYRRAMKAVVEGLGLEQK
jgi:RNA polymerase sigma factor (sigma-70 family)